MLKAAKVLPKCREIFGIQKMINGMTWFIRGNPQWCRICDVSHSPLKVETLFLSCHCRILYNNTVILDGRISHPTGGAFNQIRGPEYLQVVCGRISPFLQKDSCWCWIDQFSGCFDGSAVKVCNDLKHLPSCQWLVSGLHHEIIFGSVLCLIDSIEMCLG